jgi:hypothetical protein
MVINVSWSCNVYDLVVYLRRCMEYIIMGDWANKAKLANDNLLFIKTHIGLDGTIDW